MNWSRRHTLIAGLVLIALTNAAALGGVAWNRSGEPDAVLKLTERELVQPYGSFFDRERGGVELVINWRVLANDPSLGIYAGNYGSPEWFDEAKLKELGFNVARSPRPDRRGRHYDRQLPREALIVLEFDGPTRPMALELVRKHAAKQAADAAALPSKPEFAERAKAAAEALKREETENSRLFVVDAGLDAAALRAKYPDRTRYAIVTGKVRASRAGKGEKLQGYIEAIHNTRVNVPREIMPLGSAPSRHPPGATASAAGPAFQATIAFGKRNEPWLLGVAR